jgi:hypothetical protein
MRPFHAVLLLVIVTAAVILFAGHAQRVQSCALLDGDQVPAEQVD